jgi:hypothetical protein
MSVIVNASTSTGLGITSDNSGSVEIQSNGTTKLTVQTSGVSGTITHATAQASTSGTAIDFTGIPSWVKRVTVLLNGVSTSGTSHLLIQIGAGSVTSSGYVSTGDYNNASGSNGTVNSTSGYIVFSDNASFTRSGTMTISALGSNTWISNHTIKVSTNQTGSGGGDITLGGTLDRVRITTVNGTDTFDAGSVNIMYEG